MKKFTPVAWACYSKSGSGSLVTVLTNPDSAKHYESRYDIVPLGPIVEPDKRLREEVSQVLAAYDPVMQMLGEGHITRLREALNMDEELFQDAPRDYALKKVEDGLVSDETLALACLKFMSHDEVRDMLDANELSPRFSEDIP